MGHINQNYKEAEMMSKTETGNYRKDNLSQGGNSGSSEEE